MSFSARYRFLFGFDFRCNFFLFVVCLLGRYWCKSRTICNEKGKKKSKLEKKPFFLYLQSTHCNIGRQRNVNVFACIAARIYGSLLLLLLLWSLLSYLIFTSYCFISLQRVAKDKRNSHQTYQFFTIISESVKCIWIFFSLFLLLLLLLLLLLILFFITARLRFQCNRLHNCFMCW